jgi:hypothetical protein
VAGGNPSDPIGSYRVHPASFPSLKSSVIVSATEQRAPSAAMQKVNTAPMRADSVAPDQVGTDDVLSWRRKLLAVWNIAKTIVAPSVHRV